MLEDHSTGQSRPDTAGSARKMAQTGSASVLTFSASAPDLSGTQLGGYQLVRMIAEGGMGVVYEAIQLNLSRRVAVKILNDDLAARPEFVQRFQREAKAAAALNHPNMVQVHDFCQDDGRSFLVMEYVEGQDLGDYCEQLGKLPTRVALDIVEQAALALRAASEKAIIHRDIKPSNLMITPDGRVKVSDLGLAKILTEASDLTLTGVGMGSPYFMAPEQASDSRDVDHRADIYSLGLTLLYLLTGKRPFEGNTPFSIVLAHASKPLPKGVELGTSLPAIVEGLIQRMAAKDRQDRHPNYDTLLEDLRRVKAGHAPAFELAALKRKYLSPKTLMMAGAAAAVLIIAGYALIHRPTGNASVSRNDLPGPATQQTAVQTPPFNPSPEPVTNRATAPIAVSTATVPPNNSSVPAPQREGMVPPPWGPPPGRESSRPDQFAERGRPGPPDAFPEDGLPQGGGGFGGPGGPGDRPFQGRPPSMEGSIRFPLPRLPRPSQYPLADGPVNSMLAEADAYASAHPQDYRDIVDRYRQVMTKARGTPDESKVNQKLMGVVEQHQTALRKTLQDYETRMEALLRANKPQDAYDLWKDFPAGLRTFESDQQIAQTLQRQLPAGFSPK